MAELTKPIFVDKAKRLTPHTSLPKRKVKVQGRRSIPSHKGLIVSSLASPLEKLMLLGLLYSGF